MRSAHAMAVLTLWASQVFAASTQTVTLSCAVAYMPARSTWVREVQMDWDHKTLRAVRIDGLVPYSYSVNAQGLSTAMDNERIQIDLNRVQWSSDFRGLATGRGRCDIVAPSSLPHPR